MASFAEWTEQQKKKKKKEELTAAEQSAAGKSFTDYTKQVLGRDDIEAPLSERKKAQREIAPVKTTAENKKWFDDSVFDDGYQFGDISRAILGVGDDDATLGQLTIGSLKRGYYTSVFGEESFKAMNGTANKKDAYEKLLSSEEYQFDPGTRLASGISGAFELIGQQARQFTHPRTLATVTAATGTAALAGQAGPQIAIPEEVVTVPVAAAAAFAAGSAASSLEIEAGLAYNEMIEAGISEKTARGIALGVGGVNAGLELLQVDELLDAYKVTKASGGTKKFTKKLFDELVDRGIDVTAETTQEVMQEGTTIAGVQIGSKIDKGEWAYTADEVGNRLLDTAQSSALSFGMMNAPAAVKNTISYGTEQKAPKLTDNEQAVVDKVVESRIAEEEADGKTLTAKDKKNIESQVRTELEKGYIPIDTIEEVLGGDTYKAYKDAIDGEMSLQKEYDTFKSEYDTLNGMKRGDMTGVQQDRQAELKAQMDELKAQIENKDTIASRDQLKAQLGDEVFNIAKDSRLVESYNERARRGQAYEADLSKYDAKQQKVIKSAIDSGILNNTRRTHEFVDFIARISADKGVPFDFANNKKMAEYGFTVQGATVNGVKTDDGRVVLNIDAAKSLNSVTGHEITHILEGTKLYEKLQKAAFDFAESKGEYDSRLDALTNLYRGKKGYETNFDEKVKAELTADLVGDYLFTDEAFIKKLSVEHRNVFQKIYDEVKYLLKVATAGSAEARELEKVKKAFEDAYRADSKTSGNTKWSLTMVEAVKPTSDKWVQSASTDEVRAAHPTLYAVDEDATEKRNPTQVKGTIGSYRNIYDSLRAEGFDGTILDASSGLGYGTQAGIEEYGFDVEDIEPYPDKGYSPKYTDYSTLDKTYDVVISNAVLNVLPQDQRDALVVKMGELLNPGGRMFVNVRGKDVLNASGKIAINEANMEYFIPRTAKTGSYQKGFTKTELVAYLEDALGDGYTVKPTNLLNGVAAIVTKDGGVKYSLTDPTEDADIRNSLTEYTAEEKKAHNDAVRDYFGKTYMWAETGYLLLDGTKLDMSGKHEGAPGGYRTVDHRDIVDALGSDYGDGSYSGSLVQFMSEGNIRIIPEMGGINLSVQPTEAQEKALANYVQMHRGEVVLDIDDANGYTVASVEYPMGTHSSKVLGDIRAYFENGTKPETPIRYSLSDSEGKPIDMARVSHDEMDNKYSLSHNAEIAKGQNDYIINHKANVTAEELEEAQRVTAAMVDVMMKYSSILPEDKIGKVLTKNGSYDRSVENTTICVRTLAYNEFVDKVQEEIGRPLTQMESFLVSQKMYDIATDPQCLYCYVSLDRKAFNDMLLRYMQDRDTVIAKYNNSDKTDATIESLYDEFLHGRKPTKEMRRRFDSWISYVDNGTQLLSLADIATEERQAEIAGAKDNVLAEQLKDARKYAQSASWSKIQKDYVAYRDEILKLGDKVVKNLNEHYGMRWYSFSDYSAAFIVENMQQITDASIRGLKGLSYTKDTDYAEIFAPSGMNINISVFVNTDADGNFFIDEKQSANLEKALALREQYPNVGIVATVTNDEALRWAGDQEWTDVIIPFHIVRTGTDVAEYYKWLNYTAESADTIGDKDMWNAYLDSLNLSANARKRVSKNIYPSEHKNDKATYLNLCESRGLTPRFARFAGEDWYMKLVNETRLSADESSPLKPSYNLDAAQASFAKFVEKGGYEGGWYKEGTDVDAEAKAVAADVLAGKKANEVDYGRQDGFAPESLIAGRKANRQHGKNSLSPIGETPKTYGNYNVHGKDIALDVAPAQDAVQEDVAPVQDTVQDTVQDAPKDDNAIPEGFAPATEEDTAAIADESFAALDDADAPPIREDIYDDMPDTTAIGDNALKRIAQSVRDSLALNSRESKAIQEVIQKYSTAEMPSRDALAAEIREKFGERTWVERNEELAEVKQAIRKSPISVSDTAKGDITDYTAFMRSNFGKVRFSKNGLPVDTAYMELAELYPAYFPADITTESDQLMRIVEVANEDVNTDNSYELSDEDIYDAVDIISVEVGKYKTEQLLKAVEAQNREALWSLRGVDPMADETTDIFDEDIAPTKEADRTEPIQTAEERVAAKLQNAEAELAKNKQLRQESWVLFDEKINRLKVEYNFKKSKDTKAANDILQRIETLKRRRADVDADYAKRISDVSEKINKMNSPVYKMAEQRRAKQERYASDMENLVGDTSTWVDKKLGLSYKVNTLRRNLRDVVRDANGNRDIAKADAIYDELQGKYNHNEAALNREATRIKQPYAEMDITKAEDAYIQMLGELRHNPDTTLTEEAVTDYYNKHKKDIDKAKVDKVINDARDTYDSLLKRVNAVLKEQGMKEIPYRKGYFPHFTDPKQGFLAKLFNWKTQDFEIPTDIAGLTEAFNPNRSWQSFNKERKSDITDYSFTKGMDTYVQGALDWIYHIEDIQKRRAFENHIRYVHSDEGVKDRINKIRQNEEFDADEVQEQIDLVYKEAKNPLNNFVQDLRAGTNTLAGKKSSLDRGMEEMVNRKAYSTMTNLSNRVTGNMVVGSVSSALTNFIPITQSWVEVSPFKSLRAMGDTIRSTFRDDGTIAKSDFLTNRLRKADNLYKTGWDKAAEKAAFLMEGIDSFTSQVVWRSKYLDNLSNNMSESAAIKNADQFAENVIAGRSRGNMPTIFDSKNPLVKALTAFQLEVNNQYGYMFKDAPQDIKNKSVGRLVAGYATAFFGAYAYNALYSSLVGRDAAFDPVGIIEDLLRDMFGDDDDEEKEPAEIASGLIENVVQEAPFVGGLFGGGRIPISAAMPYDGIGEMITGTATDIGEKDYANLTKEWLNPVYYLALPFGGGQIKKTVEGLSMFSDKHPVSGSYTTSGNLRYPVEDTLGNKLQAALFGQYSNKNARYYFDNELAPLKEKQIQEYKDLELPIREYWDYREGLKGLETTEEKLDYINSLDLPIRKKNIMANNVTDRKDPIDMSEYDDYGSLDEFDFATKYPEKYDFFQKNGISYEDYKSADEDGKRAYSWAYDNPDKVPLAKAVAGDIIGYRKYTSDLYDIKADKDENGESISGSAKEKKLDYINGLDLDYGQKIILYRSLYSSKDDKATYNRAIVEYLDSRDDISWEDMKTILEELDFTVYDDGTIEW